MLANKISITESLKKDNKQSYMPYYFAITSTEIITFIPAAVSIEQNNFEMLKKFARIKRKQNLRKFSLFFCIES